MLFTRSTYKIKNNQQQNVKHSANTNYSLVLERHHSALIGWTLRTIQFFTAYIRLVLVNSILLLVNNLLSAGPSRQVIFRTGP